MSRPLAMPRPLAGTEVPWGHGGWGGGAMHLCGLLLTRIETKVQRRRAMVIVVHIDQQVHVVGWSAPFHVGDYSSSIRQRRPRVARVSNSKKKPCCEATANPAEACPFDVGVGAELSSTSFIKEGASCPSPLREREREREGRRARRSGARRHVSSKGDGHPACVSWPSHEPPSGMQSSYEASRLSRSCDRGNSDWREGY